ncbi:hypothetical protein [Mycobacteroides abscessus]|uniref:Uncharacterized protein n=1 Tax=Mycobacteroides abscessus 1948 TaxID=1299323 RepID=A0A829QP65_9MYCO|nr:hypothetical protein [Mycobacteroides abscessus]EUA64982.1 hypothetical protein I542_5160 [Mycobacteroides abscessus 1948]EIU48443.1 hypothetical protein MA6G0125S_1074 [Mycobacteroides abscessus 6G-0125-S]EIU50828.1 hypothetical protein MA6G0125R_0104 [Mycobacteroides abscessus 6G-0125-R]EIU56375.1 hypothetical protein MA6G0728S_1401 [Mycobacteroides abscessus 6G-0728-S]EIU66132.1 hypothetical protein MA6G1108_1060 [Mycobacteroides abscessus 6G-1108]
MTTTATVTHECLGGRDCRAFELIEDRGRQRRRPAATDKPNTLCRRCASDVRRAVEDLPGDYQRLDAAMEDGPSHDAPGGPKVRASTEPPIPYNVRYDALMADIAAELTAAAARITVPPKGTQLYVVTTCSKAVAANVPKLLASPPLMDEVWINGTERRAIHRSGVDIALALVNLHRQIGAELGGGTDATKIRLPYGCAACGSPSLYQHGYQVTCPDCKKDWTDDAYAELNRELVRRKEEADMRELEHAKAKLAALQRLNDGLSEIEDQSTLFTPAQIAQLLDDILAMPTTTTDATKETKTQ